MLEQHSKTITKQSLFCLSYS